MFIEILFFPILLGVVYLLPYLGVAFSAKNQKRWLGHWILTAFVANFVSCFLSWFLDDWMVQFFVIALVVGLFLTFNNQKADEIFGLVDSGVQVVKAQIDMIKEKITGSMRQHGLVQ